MACDFSHVCSLWISWQGVWLSHALVFHMRKPDTQKRIPKRIPRKTRFFILARPSYSIKRKSAQSFFVKLKLTKMNSSVSKLSSDTELSMLSIKFDFHIHVDFFMELPSSRSIHAENIFWLSIWYDHAWCEFPSSLTVDEGWITETCNNWQNKKNQLKWEENKKWGDWFETMEMGGFTSTYFYFVYNCVAQLNALHNP